MPQECWEPSRGLRAVAAARGVFGVGFCYVMMRFFFPHALLVPITVIAAAPYLAWCFARVRVLLDPAAGELAITTGFWTRHVRLTWIERVEEVIRFGAEIKIADGLTYNFSPFKRHRRLARLLRIRTGFEGMELAITRAAAAARAAGPGDAAPGDLASRHPIPAACIVCGAGLFALAVAALVRAQAGGWLVHSAAWLLRTYFGAAGAVVLLIGAWMLRRGWRGRRTARQPGQG